MILFGTLCLGAMAYGVATVFGGLVLPFTHPIIKRAAEVINDSLEKVKREDFKYTEEDGIFENRKKFRFRDFECFDAFESLTTPPYVNTTFLLTNIEATELETLIGPLSLFEKTYVTLAVPEVLRSEQRRLMLDPILAFLERIPEVRKEIE